MNRQHLLCPQCSHPIEREETFCAQCGTSFLATAQEPTVIRDYKEKGDVTCFACPACTKLVEDGSAYSLQ